MRSKKLEQGMRQAELEEQLRQSIQSMAEAETVQLERQLAEQRTHLQRDHEAAMRQLAEFQAYRQQGLRERQIKELGKLMDELAQHVAEGAAYEAAERLRVGIEEDRLAKLKTTCAKELSLLQFSPAAAFNLALAA